MFFSYFFTQNYSIESFHSHYIIYIYIYYIRSFIFEKLKKLKLNIQNYIRIYFRYLIISYNKFSNCYLIKVSIHTKKKP